MDLEPMPATAGQTLKSLVKGLRDEMQQCIQNCVSCHQICEQTLIHGLEKGGAHADPTHIKLLKDCADICALSADFMLRYSQFHVRPSSICAETCIACARHCENMGNVMKACAEACPRCAGSFSKMRAHHLISVFSRRTFDGVVSYCETSAVAENAWIPDHRGNALRA